MSSNTDAHGGGEEKNPQVVSSALSVEVVAVEAVPEVSVQVEAEEPKAPRKTTGLTRHTSLAARPSEDIGRDEVDSALDKPAIMAPQV